MYIIILFSYHWVSVFRWISSLWKQPSLKKGVPLKEMFCSTKSVLYIKDGIYWDGGISENDRVVCPENISSLSMHLNSIALRMAKTLWSFGHSECSRVKNVEQIAFLKLTKMYVFCSCIKMSVVGNLFTVWSFFFCFILPYDISPQDLGSGCDLVVYALGYQFKPAVAGWSPTPPIFWRSV